MEDYSMYSSYWAYNRSGWKPRCARCSQRNDDCKKFNSQQLGSFAGEWICTTCVKESDYKTPCQLVLDKK